MRIQERLKLSPEIRETLMRAVLVIVIVAVGFLAIDAFTQGRDGRRQVVDEDGGTETALTAILSDIKGAGTVDVLVKYDSENAVTGVIVTASGAGDIVVKSNLTNAVAAVYDIPVSNVVVFEKESGGADHEQ